MESKIDTPGQQVRITRRTYKGSHRYRESQGWDTLDGRVLRRVGESVLVEIAAGQPAAGMVYAAKVAQLEALA